jgi:hypothetical protein
VTSRRRPHGANDSECTTEETRAAVGPAARYLRGRVGEGAADRGGGGISATPRPRTAAGQLKRRNGRLRSYAVTVLFGHETERAVDFDGMTASSMNVAATLSEGWSSSFKEGYTSGILNSSSTAHDQVN